MKLPWCVRRHMWPKASGWLCRDDRGPYGIGGTIVFFAGGERPVLGKNRLWRVDGRERPDRIWNDVMWFQDYKFRPPLLPGEHLFITLRLRPHR